MFGRSSVGVAVGVGVALGVGMAVAGQVPAAVSRTRNLVPSPVPPNVIQYVFVPPSRLRTTLIVAAPLGTEKGKPLATTFSNPLFSLAIFTADGPLGAELFWYLNSVPELFLVQFPAGRSHVVVSVPLSNVIELSEP